VIAGAAGCLLVRWGVCMCGGVLAGAARCVLVLVGACWRGGLLAGAAGCLLLQIIRARERSGPRRLLGGVGRRWLAELLQIHLAPGLYSYFGLLKYSLFIATISP
jgi:hypothetical protein